MPDGIAAGVYGMVEATIGEMDIPLSSLEAAISLCPDGVVRTQLVQAMRTLQNGLLQLKEIKQNAGA